MFTLYLPEQGKQNNCLINRQVIFFYFNEFIDFTQLIPILKKILRF